MPIVTLPSAPIQSFWPHPLGDAAEIDERDLGSRARRAVSGGAGPSRDEETRSPAREENLEITLD
jgi:hypothetical protein